MDNKNYNDYWHGTEYSWVPQEYGIKEKKGFFSRLFPPRPRTHVILFILTVLATWVTGIYMYWEKGELVNSIESGFLFSVTIITILFAHEMGHYIMCRKYKVPATLPYFIPLPLLNPFGTMGAVIRMKGVIPNRKALFDIGVAGPIAGFIHTVPAIIIGLKYSTIIPVSEIANSSISLGDSFLFKMISRLVLGPINDSHDVMLHPIAYAGWAGLFVTALNLLPIGQLDGGHVIYAALGRASGKVFFAAMAGFGVCTLLYPAWALLFIILAVFGFKHPPPMDDLTPLDNKRILLGFIVMLIFLLSFTPKPFIL